MSPARTNLLSLPVELLETITLYLEYAYEISSLAQTCRRLHDVANYHLFHLYAADCSLQGLERIVKSNNVDALRKLWDNGFQFREYYDATDHLSPIQLTADPDLPEMAELLVAYTEAFLGDRRYGYDSELFEDDLKKTLCRAASKGSLGVLEALTSSKAVKKALKISALSSAIEEGQLASVRYLIEKGGVDVNTPFRDSILERCAYQGNLEMAKFLVEAGADLDMPIFKQAIHSPIHIAAASHHEEVVQYLIEMGMRLTCLKPSDLEDFLFHYKYSNLTVTNIINGNDLRTMLADIGDDPKIKYYFNKMIAVCNDLPLYQEVSGMWGSPAERDHLPDCFELAVRQENLPLARYFLDEITKRETWRDDWSKLCFSTFKSRGASFFEMLLDHGTPDPSDPDERWFRRLVNNARDYPEHMRVLLRHGYLGEIKAPHTLKEILIGAFKANDLAFVSRLIEHGELSLLNPLNSPRLFDQEQTALEITAYSSSLETFRGFLSAHDIALDPSHPIHCSALVCAALEANVDVIGYFLDEGFDVNALYPLLAIRKKKNKPAEALIIHVAKAWFVENITTTMNFLLDHGAHIDTRSSRGRTALSIALKAVGEPGLANLLFERGADPLVALELHAGHSALEQSIRLFMRHGRQGNYRYIIRASLESMSAKGCSSDDFLRLMPRVEGTLSYPDVVISREPDHWDGNSTTWHSDEIYNRWSQFFVIRELRKRYWRAMHPVPSD